MVTNVVNAFTDALADAVVSEKIEEGEGAIAASVLVRLLQHTDLHKRLDDAIMRDRLGIAPDFEHPRS